MRKILLLLFISYCFSSCNDQSQKAADELCDCLSAKTKKPSSDFKKLMKKIAQADVPSAAFKKEFNKLDEETRASVQEEINKLIETDDASVKECTQKVAEYKVRGSDESERAKKIVELMAEKSGCEVAAGQWAMAVEQTYKKGKNADEETTTNDEEETPRKKKETTEEE